MFVNAQVREGDLEEKCIGEEESVLSRLTIIGKLWGERERERERGRERGGERGGRRELSSHIHVHVCTTVAKT